MVEQCRRSKSPFRVSRHRCRVGRPALSLRDWEVSSVHDMSFAVMSGGDWKWRCASCSLNFSCLTGADGCISSAEHETQIEIRPLLLRSSGFNLGGRDRATTRREWLVIRIYHGTLYYIVYAAQRADPWKMEVWSPRGTPTVRSAHRPIAADGETGPRQRQPKLNLHCDLSLRHHLAWHPRISEDETLL